MWTITWTKHPYRRDHAHDKHHQTPLLLEEVNATLRMMESEELPAALKHIRGKMLAK